MPGRTRSRKQRRVSWRKSRPASSRYRRRIFIELVNWPFLTEFKGSPPEFGAGLRYAIEQGWFWMHESGTYLRLLKQVD
jgi:hypothetical protein